MYTKERHILSRPRSKQKKDLTEPRKLRKLGEPRKLKKLGEPRKLRKLRKLNMKSLVELFNRNLEIAKLMKPRTDLDQIDAIKVQSAQEIEYAQVPDGAMGEATVERIYSLHT